MKKGVVAVALIVATTACSSTQTGVLSVRPVNQQASGPMKDAIDRGDLLFSRGEYALALDAFRRAVRNDPADAHALNGVAISYAAMGRHDLAREFFELALSRAPEDARIYRNFARSLSAQGLRGEADALMAQAGEVSAGTRMAARPTLAQLAAGGSGVPAAAAVRPAGLELERVSLGEVRLRTMVADGRPVPARRMTPQLTTRIITIADAGASAHILSAPIAKVTNADVKVASKPDAVTADKMTRPSAEPAALPVAALKAASSSGCDGGRRTKSNRMTLPATGYSIDLPVGRKIGEAAELCGAWADQQARDGLFERIWKSLVRPARRKDARG